MKMMMKMMLHSTMPPLLATLRSICPQFGFVGGGATRRLSIRAKKPHFFSVTSHTPSQHLDPATSHPSLEALANDQRFSEKREEGFDTNHSAQVATSFDTIAAIVTPIGGQSGAVGIIRISGPSAVSIAKRVFIPANRSKNKKTWSPKSHRVEYGTLVDESGTLVDEVIVVPMLAPRSYTREDIVELQCHGGDVCIRRVLQICIEGGARLAEPGEFTLRAFLNGRLDLAQAENVLQLVQARTVAAAETALAGLQGDLSSFIKYLRNECIDLMAEFEARLDFDDELPNLDVSKLVERIDLMLNRVNEAINTAKRGKLLQSGIQVAIVGRPNVGKSSLLNVWSQSERAIVTDIAGTTRDVIEAGIVVGGFPVKLLDTAGIRKTDDVVESIGVKRSEAAAIMADIVLMMISAQDGWTSEDNDIFERLWSRHIRQGCVSSGIGPSILVVNKIDKAPGVSLELPEVVSSVFSRSVRMCVTQKIGLDQVEESLLELVGAGKVPSHGRQWAVNQRQEEHLLHCQKALTRLKSSIEEDLPIDFWTIDLREAAMALGQISGDDISEEVLSKIFSKFCIGK